MIQCYLYFNSFWGASRIKLIHRSLFSFGTDMNRLWTHLVCPIHWWDLHYLHRRPGKEPLALGLEGVCTAVAVSVGHSSDVRQIDDIFLRTTWTLNALITTIKLPLAFLDEIHGYWGSHTVSSNSLIHCTELSTNRTWIQLLTQSITSAQEEEEERSHEYWMGHSSASASQFDYNLANLNPN